MIKSAVNAAIKEMSNKIKLVKADESHIELITTYRMKLWKEAGKFSSNEEYNDLFKRNREYFKNNFKNKSIVVPMYINNKDYSIVSIGMGAVLQKPLVNWDNMGLEGYIFNMYTDAKYRGQGLATTILNEIFEYFKESNVNKVNLISNQKSFSLYKKSGMCINNFYQEINLL